MKYMVEHNFVQVVGTIWLPASTCAMEYTLDSHDVANIGKFTRANVETWLSANSGDFQAIHDFRASIGDAFLEWEQEESELTYNDCVFGTEDF